MKVAVKWTVEAKDTVFCVGRCASRIEQIRERPILSRLIDARFFQDAFIPVQRADGTGLDDTRQAVECAFEAQALDAQRKEVFEVVRRVGSDQLVQP